MSTGVVAAGHPVTAEAGAQMLREGGNAVDAAVAAVAASFVCESPLTGLGAGGYMLVHTPGEQVLVDFFVAVPGSGRADPRPESELLAMPISFTSETQQVFHVGAASCGVPGTPAGLAHAARRFGSMPLSELMVPAIAAAREGVETSAEQAFFLHILEPILTLTEEGRAIYAPRGTPLAEGEAFRSDELAEALERLGEEGPEPFYRGEVAERIAAWVLDRGGALTTDDLAAYEPVERAPARASFRGAELLTNPPPSSGGILIAFALDLLDRARSAGIDSIVRAMEAAQAARTPEFLDGLDGPGYLERFLDPAHVDEAAAALAAGRRPERPGTPWPGDALGSTTHITAVDGEGGCASVTCSNGTGSGLIVPGTGVHVNNMLGEEDLNPFGFHGYRVGRRMPSMMSPSVIMRDGRLEAGLGSGGSNRIRSALLQTVVHLVADRMDVRDAVLAPRVHFEAGAVQAEPGSDEEALARLERRGYQVVRWGERNVFFGGVHAVARDPDSGEMRGAGDPRRGGAVAYA